MKRKHKGALAELTASAWLLGQGLEVFRNVSQHGDVDIIARNPETKELLLLDVKTAPHGKGWKSFQKPGIDLLTYDPTLGTCCIEKPL